MAMREQLASRWWIGLAMMGLLLSAACNNSPEAVVPPVEVDGSDPAFVQHKGILYHAGSLFSGVKVDHYPSGKIADRTPYYKGKIHGRMLSWSTNGAKQEERYYLNGKEEGEQRGWWENGQARFVYHFEDGRYEGRVQEWYPDGQVYKDFNYEKGQESGRQQLWNKDGSYIANYLVKNGKRFGLSGEMHCKTTLANASM